MSEPLTPHGMTDHGPADPLRYNRPDEDLFAVQASEPDRLPLPTFVRDCQADIKRPRCKECSELLGERYVVDNGVTYCMACASVGADA